MRRAGTWIRIEAGRFYSILPERVRLFLGQNALLRRLFKGSIILSVLVASYVICFVAIWVGVEMTYVVLGIIDFFDNYDGILSDLACIIHPLWFLVFFVLIAIPAAVVAVPVWAMSWCAIVGVFALGRRLLADRFRWE